MGKNTNAMTCKGCGKSIMAATPPKALTAPRGPGRWQATEWLCGACGLAKLAAIVAR